MNSKNKYPQAEEFMQEVSKYRIKTDEEILDKMEKAKKLKRHVAFFRGAYISKRSKKALERKGFKVEVFYDQWNSPCFEVQWYEKK